MKVLDRIENLSVQHLGASNQRYQYLWNESTLNVFSPSCDLTKQREESEMAR